MLKLWHQARDLIIIYPKSDPHAQLNSKLKIYPFLFVRKNNYKHALDITVLIVGGDIFYIVIRHKLSFELSLHGSNNDLRWFSYTYWELSKY